MVWQRKIEPHLAQHASGAFEEAAREHLLELNRRGALLAVYDRIGGWWRGAAEVDVVAVAADGPLLVGECKWTSRPVDPEVLRALEAKVPAVQADLKRDPPRIELALFSRSGFTEELLQKARARAVLLVEVEDMLGWCLPLSREPLMARCLCYLPEWCYAILYENIAIAAMVLRARQSSQ